MEYWYGATHKKPRMFYIRGFMRNVPFFAFTQNISAKNLHLLSSRLYCRLWNLTISAALLLHGVYMEQKRVADFTAGRESHPAPKICYFVYMDYYSTEGLENQGGCNLFQFSDRYFFRVLRTAPVPAFSSTKQLHTLSAIPAS